MAQRILIVGQGLAGSILAWQLKKRSCDVFIVDSGHSVTASRIANGLINPLTGRNLSLSWKFPVLLSTALKLYREIESHFGISILQDVSLYRLIPDLNSMNRWLLRSGDPDVALYLPEQQAIDLKSPGLNQTLKYLKINHSYQLNTSVLLDQMKKFFLQQGVYRCDFVNMDDIEPETAAWKQEYFDCIVFCEGAAGIRNPFFHSLPFRLNKGECLHLKFSQLDFGGILNGDGVLGKVPGTSDVWYAGSTYYNQFDDDQPSETGQTEILRKVSRFYSDFPVLLQHLSALRPSTANRRPFLGKHPVYDKLYMFNGMGTKGASLIPHFSEQMADFILKGIAPDPETNLMTRKDVIWKN